MYTAAADVQRYLASDATLLVHLMAGTSSAWCTLACQPYQITATDQPQEEHMGIKQDQLPHLLA